MFWLKYVNSFLNRILSSILDSETPQVIISQMRESTGALYLAQDFETSKSHWKLWYFEVMICPIKYKQSFVPNYLLYSKDSSPSLTVQRPLDDTESTSFHGLIVNRTLFSPTDLDSVVPMMLWAAVLYPRIDLAPQNKFRCYAIGSFLA